MLPQNVLGINAPPSVEGERGKRKMDYKEKLEKIDRHIAEHPKDYQSVIARMKTFSDAVDNDIHNRRVARMKKVMKYMRGEEDGSK